MERTIHNLNEWTSEELYNLEDLIADELERRTAEKEEEIKDKIRTALLEYADYLDSNNFTKIVGYTTDEAFDEIPVEISTVIDWFAPAYY